MNTTKTLLAGTDSAYRQQLAETKGLVNKWEKTGLLEGVKAEYDRHGMAIMLENQAKQILREANYTSTAQYHE